MLHFMCSRTRENVVLLSGVLSTPTHRSGSLVKHVGQSRAQLHCQQREREREGREGGRERDLLE